MLPRERALIRAGGRLDAGASWVVRGVTVEARAGRGSDSAAGKAEAQACAVGLRELRDVLEADRDKLRACKPGQPGC